MVSSIHKALFTLGIITLLSTVNFTHLDKQAGSNVSGYTPTEE